MKIGIPGYEMEGFFGANSQYMDFASIVGTPVILSPDADLMGIDGILLPGGSDVIPSRYGVPGFFTGRASPHLEYFDTHILPDIIGKLPIFGICRGLQAINVCLGGTLVQHLFFHPHSSTDADLVHEVDTPEESSFKKFGVNSFHHQCIGHSGEGIQVELVDVQDKFFDTRVIEAISGKLFHAVQWHPERIRDSYSICFFRDLFK